MAAQLNEALQSALRGKIGDAVGMTIDQCTGISECTVIDLTGKQIASWENIMCRLTECAKLTVLRLGQNKLTETDLQMLGKALQSMPDLKELDLHACGINKGLQHITGAFTMLSLHKLDISQNCIDTDAFRSITDFIATAGTICTINASSNKINEGSLRELLDAMTKTGHDYSSRDMTLDLSNNSIPNTMQSQQADIKSAFHVNVIF